MRTFSMNIRRSSMHSPYIFFIYKRNIYLYTYISHTYLTHIRYISRYVYIYIYEYIYIYCIHSSHIFSTQFSFSFHGQIFHANFVHILHMLRTKSIHMIHIFHVHSIHTPYIFNTTLKHLPDIFHTYCINIQ